VAVHRKHHRFSDQEGDTQSPYLRGMWTVLFGNFWFYRKEKSDPATPGWEDDFPDSLPGMHYSALGGLAIFMLMFRLDMGLGGVVHAGGCLYSAELRDQ